MLLKRVVWSLLFAGSMSACTVTPNLHRALQPVEPEVMPPPNLPSITLTTDLLFDITLAEIAVQRRQYGVAEERYFNLALQTQDPRLAEKSTKLALMTKNDERGAQTAALWLELDPSSLSALQHTALFSLRLKKIDQAKVLLANILKYDDKPKFLEVSGSLARELEPEQAKAIMKELIEPFSENVEALYAYSHMVARFNHLDESLQVINKALKSEPALTKAILLKVRIMQAAGKPQEAMAYLKSVLQHKKSRGDELLHKNYGALLLRHNQFEEAEKQFHWVAKNSQQSAEAWYTLGLISLKTGRLEKAKSHFLKAKTDGKINGQVDYYLGLIEESLGHEKAALEHYFQVGPGPNYLDAQLHIAGLLEGLEGYEVAIDHLHSIQVTDPKQKIKFIIKEGSILLRAERIGATKMLYTQAINNHPESNDLYYFRAIAAEKGGDIVQAEDDLRLILSRSPDDAKTLNALGYMLADKTTHFKEAYDLIKKALAIQPDDYFFLDSLGWVYYRMGNYGEALKYLQQALNMSEDPEVAAHLGEVLWVSGDKEKAHDVWQKALKKTPKHKALRKVVNQFEP